MRFTPTNTPINDFISEKDTLSGIISIWGDVGVGKTTFCFAAALNVLNYGKKVIYISTARKFEFARLKLMLGRYRGINMEKFVVYNPDTISQLAKLVMNLEFLLLEEIRFLGKTSVGLIVLDTATGLFHTSIKSGYDSILKKQSNQLNIFLAELDKLREKYRIPIMITNRSVSSIKEDDEKVVSHQASPKTMAYWTKTSIKLERLSTPGYRAVILVKHPRNKLRKARIKLASEGIK